MTPDIDIDLDGDFSHFGCINQCFPTFLKLTSCWHNRKARRAHKQSSNRQLWALKIRVKARELRFASVSATWCMGQELGHWNSAWSRLVGTHVNGGKHLEIRVSSGTKWRYSILSFNLIYFVLKYTHTVCIFLLSSWCSAEGFHSYILQDNVSFTKTHQYEDIKVEANFVILDKSCINAGLHIRNTIIVLRLPLRCWRSFLFRKATKNLLQQMWLHRPHEANALKSRNL